jgi:hypothetical protein
MAAAAEVPASSHHKRKKSTRAFQKSLHQGAPVI